MNIKRLPFQATAILSSHSTVTPLKAADHVVQFAQGALCDTLGRLPAGNSAPHNVKDLYDLIAWAQTHGLKQIITCYEPVSPIADQVKQARKLLEEHGILLVTVMAPTTG